MKYWFSAFGVRIVSDLDLLGVNCGPGAADISLRILPATQAVLPSKGQQWARESTVGESWALLPGIARVIAREGSDVSVEPLPGLDQATLRAISISTAVPLALQQREGLLLEASAVCWEGKGLLMIGRGLCGKSTLAASLADAGATLVADSHVFLQLDSGGDVTMAPAFPHVRLAAGQSSMLAGSWPEPFPLRPGIKKDLYVVPERFVRERVRIKGLIFLQRGVDSNFRVRQLELGECLQALALASDRLRAACSRGVETARFRVMSTLASLPICHSVQWSRIGKWGIGSRDRVISLLRELHWSRSG